VQNQLGGPTDQLCIARPTGHGVIIASQAPSPLSPVLVARPHHVLLPSGAELTATPTGRLQYAHARSFSNFMAVSTPRARS